MPTDPQADVLTQSTLAAIERLNEAINRRDLEAVMAPMTDDCVFENTYPPPDGERFEGQAAVRAFWAQFFASSSQAFFEFEEIFAHGERGVARWRYRWVDATGQAGHIRGVDVFRVRAGKIAEKFSYVKG